jgi:hypothetical protein
MNNNFESLLVIALIIIADVLIISLMKLVKPLLRKL